MMWTMFDFLPRPSVADLFPHPEPQMYSSSSRHSPPLRSHSNGTPSPCDDPWSNGLSDHGFRTIVEQSLVGVVVVQDGKIVYLNSRMAEIVGYDREELSAMDSIFEFIHPDDHDLVSDRIRRRLSGEEPEARYKFRLIHAGGRVVHVQVHGSVSTYEGRPAVVSSIQDVTDQLATLERLQESEQRFRQLAENAKDFIFRYRIRPEREFEYVSAAAIRTTGYSPEEFYRSPNLILRLVHPADRPLFRRLVDGDEQSSEPVIMRLRRKDGRIIWTEQQFTLVRDDEGRVAAIEGIGRDISLRIEAQEHGRLLSAAMEAAANAIVITNSSGTIEWVNPAFSKLTGYSADEAVGSNPRLLKSGTHDARFYRNLWTTIHSGDVWQGQVVNRRKDGTVYTEEQTITPVTDRTGEISNFIAIKQDVSDRVKYEEGLVAARNRAEEMVRTKNALLNNLSHELRTPLTAILGFAQLLVQEVPEDLLELAEQVHRGGTRLKETFDSVLDLARIESDSVYIQPEYCDLLQEAQSIVSAFRLQVEEKKGLKTTVSGDDALVYVDRIVVDRILHNLVSNAVKFTNKGEIRVEISSRMQGVLIRVADTGQGISEEFLPRIFDEFQQESTGLSRTHDGIGLGLTIVRRLVELHDGSINVISRKGHGSTFTVWIPDQSKV